MTFEAARRVESVCVTEWDKHGHVVNYLLFCFLKKLTLLFSKDALN